eukprot:1624515-Rhodomonas_salina.3
MMHVRAERRIARLQADRTELYLDADRILKVATPISVPDFTSRQYRILYSEGAAVCPIAMLGTEVPCMRHRPALAMKCHGRALQRASCETAANPGSAESYVSALGIAGQEAPT